jgi:hypothetical protein
VKAQKWVKTPTRVETEVTFLAITETQEFEEQYRRFWWQEKRMARTGEGEAFKRWNSWLICAQTETSKGAKMRGLVRTTSKEYILLRDKGLKEGNKSWMTKE